MTANTPAPNLVKREKGRRYSPYN